MENYKKVDESFKVLESVIRHGLFSSETKPRFDKLTGSHGAIIGYICSAYLNKKDIYQRDIEREYGLKRSTVSGIVKDLEKEGIITRNGVDKDARLKQVVPTEKGLKMHDEAQSEAYDRAKNYISGIPTSDIDTFCKVIRQIELNAQK